MPALTVYIDDRAMEALESVARVTGRSTTDLASAAVEEAAIQARRGGTPPGPMQGRLPLTSLSQYPRMDSDYPAHVHDRNTGFYDSRYPIGDPRRG